VHVLSLGREGVLRGISGQKAEVRLGGAVFTVPLDDLRPPSAGAGRGAAPAVRAERRAARGQAELAAAARSAQREVVLLGFRVDEALDAVEKLLDAARLDGLTEVRIVHGFGTGALKRAIREHLGSHPFVASWRDGRAEEGGGGATVVALRED
jgi:DNA mismatch repair protein MutS2